MQNKEACIAMKGREILKQVFRGTLVSLVIGGYFYCFVYFRFAHPELTQTQLLIALWKEELGLVVLTLYGVFTMEGD